MTQADSPGVAAILEELKRELRLRGIRVPDLARQLDIAEPTLWRWLRGRGLTLDNLDRICLTLGIDIRDLIGRSGERGADRFTLAQERVLAADRTLALFFFLILNGAQRDDIAVETGLDAERIDTALQRLRRLGLIDVHPGGRLRARTSRAVRWHPGGPLDQAFDRVIKPMFLERSLREGDARYVSDMVRLSAAGRGRVLALFEALRDDIYLIARQEREAASAELEWSALFMLVRPLDMEEVRRDLS